MSLRLDPELSRQVWKLAYPICLGNLSQILLGVVDTAMLGRLSPAATEKRTPCSAAKLWIIRAPSLSFWGYIHPSLPGLPVSSPQPWRAGPRWGSSLGYICMQYRFYGAAFALCNLAFGGFFNGIGRTKVRMTAAIILTAVNVLLDYLLIFGKFGFPELGVKGAAIASTLATTLAFLYYIGGSLAKGYRARFECFRPPNIDFTWVGRIVRLSLPLMLRSLVGTGGYLAFFWIVGRIGTVEVAASNVIRSLLSVSWMFGTSMGAAATTLVGQHIGAGEPEKAELSGWEAVKLSAIVMGIIGALFLFFPSPLMHIYTDDLGVISVGIPVLKLLSIAQIFAAIGLVLSSAIVGAGDMHFVLGVEIGNTCFLYLPLAWFLGVYLGFGIIGAWSAEVIYVLFYALLMALRFRGGSWKGIRI